MLQSFLVELYRTKIEITTVVIAGSVVIWALLYLVIRNARAEKKWQLLNIVASAALIVAVLCVTLLTRSEEIADIRLMPFLSLQAAKTQPEVYRMLLLNGLMFLPLGVTMPFAMGKKLKRPGLVTAVCLVLFSVAVEAVQGILHMGVCETDDVIMNTVGVLVGVGLYSLVKKLKKPAKKA